MELINLGYIEECMGLQIKCPGRRVISDSCCGYMLPSDMVDVEMVDHLSAVMPTDKPFLMSCLLSRTQIIDKGLSHIFTFPPG